jgi:hypothetical protein
MILLRLLGQNLLELFLLQLRLLALGGVGVELVEIELHPNQVVVGVGVLLFGVFIMLMICLRL